jgi:hypothetical protein
MVVAVVALLASLTAGALSVYAIATANGAKSDAAPAPGKTQGGGVAANPATAGATPAKPTTKAAAVPTATAGELDPKADFTEAYTPSTKKLALHPQTSGTRYIDLDKPEVGVEQDKADLLLYSYNGEFLQFPERIDSATAPSPDVQANDCAELIISAKLPEDAKLSVNTPDLTVCVLTSFQAAQRQGLSRKLVLVHVTSVAADGTVNVDLKAWNVPL